MTGTKRNISLLLLLRDGIMFLSMLPQTLVPDIETPQATVSMGGHDLKWLAIEHFSELNAPQHIPELDTKFLKIQHVL